MKVTIEMDMTPEEARAFMGLPDVAPMQKNMLDEMQARMKQAFDANDPEGMMRAWMPLGGAEAFQKFQKLMWDSAAGLVKKRRNQHRQDDAILHGETFGQGLDPETVERILQQRRAETRTVPRSPPPD